MTQNYAFRISPRHHKRLKFYLLDNTNQFVDNNALFNERNFNMTLTKAELADILVEKVAGMSKHDAKEIVELFFEEIRSTLEQGEQIKISGFGNFQLRDKPQRPGRNPKTGEEVPISARRVVTFHASQKLKGMVDHYNGKQA